jgi:dihydroxyacetone kinase
MAHEDLLALNEVPVFVCRRSAEAGSAWRSSPGGGSGTSRCTPAMSVPGMLDAACPGQCSPRPHPDQIVAAADGVSRRGQGVLLIVKNYAATCASFQVGERHARDAECATVLGQRRRGRSSTPRTPPGGAASPARWIVEKMIGAAAEGRRRPVRMQGARRTRQHQHRVDGRGRSPSCIVPEADAPTFDIGSPRRWKSAWASTASRAASGAR